VAACWHACSSVARARSHTPDRPRLAARPPTSRTSAAPDPRLGKPSPAASFCSPPPARRLASTIDHSAIVTGADPNPPPMSQCTPSQRPGSPHHTDRPPAPLLASAPRQHPILSPFPPVTPSTGTTAPLHLRLPHDTPATPSGRSAPPPPHFLLWARPPELTHVHGGGGWSSPRQAQDSSRTAASGRPIPSPEEGILEGIETGAWAARVRSRAPTAPHWFEVQLVA
jgi:hypothetical protein